MREGAGRYPQPVALLARLGIHREHEGHMSSVEYATTSMSS